MAPSRRKGASKAVAPAAARRKWKIGDLVLAKVKGYPSWPATVTEAEKWGFAADRKKVVVQFFGGTKQISFCNPADLEEFTKEKKVALLGKRHGKGADFVRAVNEIIDSFEKLKKQDQVSEDNETEGSNIADENIDETLTESVDDDVVVTAKQLYAEIANDLNSLTEAAIAAAAEDALHDEEMHLNEAPHNLLSTETPVYSTHLTRNKSDVAGPQKSGSRRRKSTQVLRSSSKIDTYRPRNTMMPSAINTRSVRNSNANESEDRSLIRSERIVKSEDSVEEDVKSLTFESSDKIEKSDSETMTVESDTLSINYIRTGDSGCKPAGLDQPIAENNEGITELSDRLDFQGNNAVNKKKRKLNRKRHNNDTVEAAKPDLVVYDAGILKNACVSPTFSEKSTQKYVKDDGDEHLPLVKRARVRMGMPSPTTEELILVHEGKEMLEAPRSLVAESFEPLSCQVAHADTDSVQIGEDRAISSVSHASPCKKFILSETRKTCVDDEAALPPSKRLHRALEAMSANVAVDCERALYCLPASNIQSNGDYPSFSECSALSMGNRAKVELESESIDSLRNGDWQPNASQSCIMSDVINSDSKCMEETAGGSSNNGNCVRLDSADGESETNKTERILLPENDHDSKRSESVEEASSASLGSNSMSLEETHVKDLSSSHHHSVVNSASISCDHVEDGTISFSHSSSPLTNGVDGARASSPSSSLEVLDCKNSLENNNSSSSDFQLHLEIAKHAGKSTDKREYLSSFEAIIRSLTRTKESIGRATTIAIDCAKHGFATKVVEILAQNLEFESSLHRKVDLFFLLDSITQCSRGIKGDGGVYPSAIQALLPRLLLAAAPPGSNSRENHRQCLKVLRVWQERKILPEPIIRHHIRELDVLCGSTATASYPIVGSQRPLRNERSFDDPIREMGGMLVDEYGSNSSIQLPGFCMPRMLRDVDGGSDSDGEGFEAVTPEHNVEDRDGGKTLIPVLEKRSHILEDVDGELEMEDVAPCCEGEIASTSNIDGAAHLSSNHLISNNHFAAPSIPQQHKDVSTASTSSSSSTLPLPPHHTLAGSTFPNAVCNSDRNGPDSKPYSSRQEFNSNFQANRADQSVHHRVSETKDFESHMHSSSDCSYRNRPTSYSSGRVSNNSQRIDSFNKGGFHLRPPHPAPSNQFSYVHDQRIQSRRDFPPPSHSYRHHTRNAENGYLYKDRSRNKFVPHDNIGESWRPPFPSISGPCYPDDARMGRSPMSFSGPPCEPPYPNNRWNIPPRPMNHRHVNYRPTSEGPVPVANRGPFWRPR